MCGSELEPSIVGGSEKLVPVLLGKGGPDTPILQGDECNGVRARIRISDSRQGITGAGIPGDAVAVEARKMIPGQGDGAPALGQDWTAGIPTGADRRGAAGDDEVVCDQDRVRLAPGRLRHLAGGRVDEVPIRDDNRGGQALEFTGRGRPQLLGSAVGEAVSTQSALLVVALIPVVDHEIVVIGVGADGGVTADPEVDAPGLLPRVGRSRWGRRCAAGVSRRGGGVRCGGSRRPRSSC